MEIEIKTNNDPQDDPQYFTVSMSKKQYSEVKLHIARDKNGKASVAPGKRWYVWFLWRNPKTNRLDLKYTFTRGINRYKTVKERKAVGKAMKEAITTALAHGWSPVKNKKIKNTEVTTLRNALDHAIKVKKRTKKISTVEGYIFHLRRFQDWAKTNAYAGMDVKRFSIGHFYEFLDFLRFEYVKDNGDSLSGTSVNNHKASLSSLFTTLVKERLINFNYIKDIPALESEPVNNKAFTLEELKKLKEWFSKNDPYMNCWLSFIIYPLLRPLEIARLKVNDINTDDWVFSVETKTDKLSTRRIIKKIKPVLEEMELDKYPGDYELFSNLDRPKDWSSTKLKSRANHFTARFKKAKDALGFGREYGPYSCRHTAIMNLYNSLQQSGMSEQEILFKLMPITQHRSVAGITNYLRDKKAFIPADHSDIYTLEF